MVSHTIITVDIMYSLPQYLSTRWVCLKSSGRMTNSADHEQTALSRLVWVLTDCSEISDHILVNTV